VGTEALGDRNSQHGRGTKPRWDLEAKSYRSQIYRHDLQLTNALFKQYGILSVNNRGSQQSYTLKIFKTTKK